MVNIRYYFDAQYQTSLICCAGLPVNNVIHCVVELKGNPLPQNIISLLNDSNGIQKLLAYLFDQVHSMFSFVGLFVLNHAKGK